MSSSVRPPATLLDIANATGVSVATVSKVLNNRVGVRPERRERIRAALEQFSYQKPQPRPRTAPLAALTVTTFDRYAANDHYYVATMRGITDEAERLGCTMALELALLGEGYTAVDPASLFRRDPPSAVLLLGIDQAPVVEAVAALGCPAVIVNGMDPSMRLSSISPDHYYGSWAAAHHLIAAGHRRLLHLTHIYRDTMQHRLDGFCLALAQAGIPFDATRDVLDTGSASLSSLSASQAIERRLAEGPLDCTGIVCASDMLALGAMQALLSAGYRVPQDVSVIGFDDLPISEHCEVPLSTMHVEREEMGRLAVRTLYDLNATPQASPRRIEMGMRLVERASVAPPPA